MYMHAGAKSRYKDLKSCTSIKIFSIELLIEKNTSLCTYNVYGTPKYNRNTHMSKRGVVETLEWELHQNRTFDPATILPVTISSHKTLFSKFRRFYVKKCQIRFDL